MKRVLLIGLMLLSFAFVFTACNGGNNSKENTTSTDKKESGQLAKDEMYTCTMHRQVMSEHPGHCSICGMTLTKEKMTAEQEKMMKEGTYVKSKEEQ